MKNSKYLIVYSNHSSNTNYIGFSFFEKKQADLYMKCVNLLSENEIEFNVEEVSEIYNSDDFLIFKSSQYGFDSSLFKMFDADDDASAVGIFPDAITDAYDNDLLNEDEF